MKKWISQKSILAHLIFLRFGQDLLSDPTESITYGNNHKKETSNRRVILVVGMLASSHLHTWIDGMVGSSRDAKIWIFPSDCPEKKYTNPDQRIRSFPFVFFGKVTNYSFRVFDLIFKKLWRTYFLHLMIKFVAPTHLHFHELQHGAYLYNAVANHPKNKFSGTSITSTWGSDLLVYGNISEHQKDIEKVLGWTDILTAERRDDFEIAVKLGFKGEFQAPTYITIGNRSSNSSPLEIYKRNSVVIKGYQDSHGRALNALQAVVDAREGIDLDRYIFYVYSASDSVRIQMELLSVTYGINFIALPRMPKKQLMQYFDEARVYIGLAISDGLSTSMVEAMAHGVFPIQSKNSAASDFLVHGLSGGVVDPWDISEISTLLKLALTDDLLVDQASKLNKETLLRKYNWDEGIIRLQRLYSTRHRP